MATQAPAAQQDPLTEARARGLAARARLLVAEGGVLSSAQVAGRLDVSQRTVHRLR